MSVGCGANLIAIPAPDVLLQAGAIGDNSEQPLTVAGSDVDANPGTYPSVRMLLPGQHNAAPPCAILLAVCDQLFAGLTVSSSMARAGPRQCARWRRTDSM
jgi:hypothetical protein